MPSEACASNSHQEHALRMRSAGTCARAKGLRVRERQRKFKHKRARTGLQAFRTEIASSAKSTSGAG